MLTLYHYDRSTAAQRVRLGLDEKKIKWNSVIVDTAMGDASKRPDGFRVLDEIVPWNGVQATFGPLCLGSREFVIAL